MNATTVLIDRLTVTIISNSTGDVLERETFATQSDMMEFLEKSALPNLMENSDSQLSEN